jgi:hypothetical protein
MSALLLFLGFIVLISGLAWLATLFGVAQLYVSGAALTMLAVALVTTFATSRAQGPLA